MFPRQVYYYLNTHISVYNLPVRRKPGALVPLEESILAAAVELQNARVQEFHGYQLARHVAAVSDRRLLTAYGTLYRALARLEKMGLLQSHWEDPQLAANENRPGRRLYALTGAGIASARANRQIGAPSKGPKRGRRRVAPA
jgi:PadR family transcriptional regulator, regulatory protein PadR